MSAFANILVKRSPGRPRRQDGDGVQPVETEPVGGAPSRPARSPAACGFGHVPPFSGGSFPSGALQAGADLEVDAVAAHVGNHRDVGARGVAEASHRAERPDAARVGDSVVVAVRVAVRGDGRVVRPVLGPAGRRVDGALRVVGQEHVDAATGRIRGERDDERGVAGLDRVRHVAAVHVHRVDRGDLLVDVAGERPDQVVDAVERRDRDVLAVAGRDAGVRRHVIAVVAVEVVRTERLGVGQALHGAGAHRDVDGPVGQDALVAGAHVRDARDQALAREVLEDRVHAVRAFAGEPEVLRELDATGELVAGGVDVAGAAGGEERGLEFGGVEVGQDVEVAVALEDRRRVRAPRGGRQAGRVVRAVRIVAVGEGVAVVVDAVGAVLDHRRDAARIVRALRVVAVGEGVAVVVDAVGAVGLGEAEPRRARDATEIREALDRALEIGRATLLSHFPEADVRAVHEGAREPGRDVGHELGIEDVGAGALEDVASQNVGVGEDAEVLGAGAFGGAHAVAGALGHDADRAGVQRRVGDGAGGRVAHVERAGVVVVVVGREADAGARGVAGVLNGAQVAVVAGHGDLGLVDADAVRTGVDRAGVVVVAVEVLSLAHARVAGVVDGAQVAVVAGIALERLSVEDAAGDHVAGVGRAGVVVVAGQRRVGTQPELVAGVDRAGVAVVADGDGVGRALQDRLADGHVGRRRRRGVEDAARVALVRVGRARVRDRNQQTLTLVRDERGNKPQFGVVLELTRFRVHPLDIAAPRRVTRAARSVAVAPLHAFHEGEGRLLSLELRALTHGEVLARLLEVLDVRRDHVVVRLGRHVGRALAVGGASGLRVEDVGAPLGAAVDGLRLGDRELLLDDTVVDELFDVDEQVLVERLVHDFVGDGRDALVLRSRRLVGVGATGGRDGRDEEQGGQEPQVLEHAHGLPPLVARYRTRVFLPSLGIMPWLRGERLSELIH